MPMKSVEVEMHKPSLTDCNTLGIHDDPCLLIKHHYPLKKSVCILKNSNKPETIKCLQFWSTFCRGSKRPLVHGAIMPRTSFSSGFLPAAAWVTSPICLESETRSISDFFPDCWITCTHFTGLSIPNLKIWNLKCSKFQNFLTFLEWHFGFSY